MPSGAAAVRQEALLELRLTVAAIRSAARLLERVNFPSASRPVVRAIARGTARAERALTRLERSMNEKASPQ
jgi:hypothetical protein